MGLKPGGLRGSLRNLSTGVVPASIVIDTLEAEDIDADSATIRGEIVDMADGYPDAQVHFEWGEDGMGLPESTDLQSLGSVQIFTEELTGLTEDQQYEFRAHGELANVEDEGAVLTFSTEVAIPDSAVAHFNAQSLSGLSDGDPVSTWDDETETADASGSGTYRDSAINGYPAVEIDTDDDGYTADIGTYSQTNTIFAVAEAGFSDTIGEFRMIVSSRDDTAANQVYWGSGDDWRIYSGSSISGSSDVDRQLFRGVFDSPSSVLAEDGTETATGDTGSHSLADLSIGFDDAFGGRRFGGHIGLVEVHDGLPSNGLETREQEIADMWGIQL